MKLDPVIHLPARLQIMTCLAAVDRADYNYLKKKFGFTDGNLATHVRKLEEAEYIEVHKEFVGRKPKTSYEITKVGRTALTEYVRTLEELFRGLPGHPPGMD